MQTSILVEMQRNPYRSMSRTLAEFPFETRLITDETVNLREIFATNHCLNFFVESLLIYENRVFTGFEPANLRLRNVLHYQRPMHLSTAPDLAQIYPPVAETYDALCGLIASYCLVEKWAGWDGLADVPVTGLIPKRLDEKLLDKLSPPYWTKMEGLPAMLRQARKTVASLVAPPSSLDQPDIPPHFKHLRDLALGEAKTTADAVIDNFRAASMHLSYILSLPAGHQSGAVLPDLPKDWSQLTSQAGPWTQAEVQTISRFIQSANASTAKIRLILHLALMVSPIYLLVPSALRKTKSFTRETLFKLATALGNQKPELLRNFEGEIWAALRDVAIRNVDLETALFQLVRSSTWTEMEELLPTDPSATFFCRLRTMMVPVPTLPMLTAPVPAPSPAFFVPTPPLMWPLPLSVVAAVSSEPTPSTPSSMASLLVPRPAPLTLSSISRTSSFVPPQVLAPSPVLSTSSGLAPRGLPDLRMPESMRARSASPLPSQPPALDGSEHADPSLGNLDEDSDRSTPSPENFGHVDDIEGGSLGHLGDSNVDDVDVDAAGVDVTTGLQPSEKNTTRISSRLEKLKAAQEKMKLDATRQTPAPAAPSKPKKGKGRKKPKTVKSKEIVESEVEDRDTFEPKGDKRGRHEKNGGIAPEKAPKRPRFDNSKADGYSEDEDEDDDVYEYKIPMWERIEYEVFVADPEPMTLDIDKIPTKYTAANEVRAFGPADPNPVVFRPVVQDEETLEVVDSIAAAVQASYLNGLPLHLADPARSVIKIIPEPEFARMSDLAVQDVLRGKHILITGIPHEENTFKGALRDTASLGSRVSIQDQSQPVGKNANDRVYKGTLRMVVECSENPDGKILNALDIPQPYGSRVRTQFSSDLHALLATLHGIGWRPGMPIYTEDFRWAIASLKGAFHGFHLDSDGLGTFIKALCGSKWWILASPRPESQAHFAKINTFLAGNFNLDEAPAGWQLEGIVLTPGMQLIMGPNAPHSVITIEHSVFEGGHYIATSTIKDTFYSLIHGFVAGGYIGNTDHTASRFVLRQMLAFYHEALVLGRIDQDEKAWSHVPDVLTADGRIGLMTLCSFGILCNVLDFDTYRFPKQGEHDKLPEKKAKKLHDHDFNAMTPLNRVHCMRTRALALDLVEWLSWRYAGINWMEHFGCTLARHAGALYVYKLKAEGQKIGGAPHCTLDSLQTQLEGILSPNHDRSNLQGYIDRVIDAILVGDIDFDEVSMSVDNLWNNLSLHRSSEEGEYNSPIDLMSAGISERDKLYMAYTRDPMIMKRESFDKVDYEFDSSDEDGGHVESPNDLMEYDE